jgi:hypothetical protein
LKELVPFQHANYEIDGIHSTFRIVKLESAAIVKEFHLRVLGCEPLHETCYLHGRCHPVGIKIVAFMVLDINVVGHPVTSGLEMRVQVIDNTD